MAVRQYRLPYRSALIVAALGIIIMMHPALGGAQRLRATTAQLSQESREPRLLVPHPEERGTPATESAALPLPDRDEFRESYGYSGPYYRPAVVQRGAAEVPGAEEVVVLEQTLTARPTGNWKVYGMVRNQTPAAVKITAIIARPIGSHGDSLQPVTAKAFLSVLRAGEPAPFEVSADAAPTVGSSVQWHVAYEPTPEPKRMFKLRTFWQLPFGERMRHVGYPLDDPMALPYPYVIFGSVESAESVTINRIRVLGTWFDDKGRVLHVDWLFLLSGADYKHRHDNLPVDAGEAHDFIYTNADPSVAPRLADATVALWAIGD